MKSFFYLVINITFDDNWRFKKWYNMLKPEMLVMFQCDSWEQLICALWINRHFWRDRYRQLSVDDFDHQECDGHLSVDDDWDFCIYKEKESRKSYPWSLSSIWVLYIGLKGDNVCFFDNHI